MAPATPQLFNSADFAVIAELLYRRTGLLIQPNQVKKGYVSRQPVDPPLIPLRLKRIPIKNRHPP